MNDELNIDVPVEEPTLAPTDEIIPAPVEDTTIPTDDNCKCNTCCQECNPVTIGGFFGTIQESVTITWRMHLKTKKHYIHVALNEFYDDAIKIVDNIIEQYQGICGIVEEPFVNCIAGEGKTESEYLNELKTFVETNKSILGDHTEINSTIDEFLSLIDAKLYKIISFCENVVKSFEEFCYEELNEKCCGCKKDFDDEQLDGECAESCCEEEEE